MRLLLAEPDRRVLPAARRLASTFGVSYVTILKALRLLRDEGALSMYRGSAARAPSGANGALPEADRRRTSSCERFAAELEAGIADGTYRAGDPLPKVQYFVLEKRVSNRTVLAAYAQLSRRGLVHRRGRQWYVGSRLIRAGNDIEHPQREILVVQNSEGSWRKLCETPKSIGRFARRFAEECAKLRVRIVPAVYARERIRYLEGLVPQGDEEVRAAVSRLGTRFLGTLVPLEQDYFRELPEFSERMLRFGKPVVWFDSANKGLSPPLSRPGFYRCHPDHDAASREILRCLAAAGHEVVGVPRFYYHKWMDSVVRSFETAAAGLDPPLRLCAEREARPGGPASWSNHPAHEVITWLRSPPAEGLLRRRLCALAAGIPRGTVAAAKRDRTILWETLERSPGVPVDIFTTLWMTPVLLPLVRDQGATAFVCPGGKYAPFCYYWCSAAGLAVPRHLSLVCIDDSYEFFPYPMSSIDLGYDYLGYAAAHLFMGEIPVRARRDGTVTAPVRLIERGSVGPVRRRPRKVLTDEVLTKLVPGPAS